MRHLSSTRSTGSSDPTTCSLITLSRSRHCMLQGSKFAPGFSGCPVQYYSPIQSQKTHQMAWHQHAFCIPHMSLTLRWQVPKTLPALNQASSLRATSATGSRFCPIILQYRPKAPCCSVAWPLLLLYCVLLLPHPALVQLLVTCYPFRLYISCVLIGVRYF